MNSNMFGPHIHAKVHTDSSGKVTTIDVIHPKGKPTITIPGDWAADLSGTNAEIARDISESLNGASVSFV